MDLSNSLVRAAIDSVPCEHVPWRVPYVYRDAASYPEGIATRPTRTSECMVCMSRFRRQAAAAKPTKQTKASVLKSQRTITRTVEVPAHWEYLMPNGKWQKSDKHGESKAAKWVAASTEVRKYTPQGWSNYCQAREDRTSRYLNYVGRTINY